MILFCNKYLAIYAVILLNPCQCLFLRPAGLCVDEDEDGEFEFRDPRAWNPAFDKVVSTRDLNQLFQYRTTDRKQAFAFRNMILEVWLLNCRLIFTTNRSLSRTFSNDIAFSLFQLYCYRYDLCTNDDVFRGFTNCLWTALQCLCHMTDGCDTDSLSREDGLSAGTYSYHKFYVQGSPELGSQ